MSIPITLVPLPLIDLPPITRFRRWLYRWSLIIRRYVWECVLVLITLAVLDSAIHLYRIAPTDQKLTLIGILLGTAATLLLVLVAIVELWRISRTASADLIFRLTSRFFEPHHRILVSLIEGDYLQLEAREPIHHSYFLVLEEKILETSLHQEIKNLLLSKKAYSVQEIDDFLGQFEDLAALEKQNTLDVRLIYSAFSLYMDEIWKSEAIQDYIELSRTQSADFFEGFETLIKKCKAFRT